MLIDMDSSGGALLGAKMSMEEQKGDISVPSCGKMEIAQWHLQT